MTASIVWQRDPASGAIIYDAGGNPTPAATQSPIIKTYGQLQQRIADEVLGSVTAQHIVNAIGDAIDNYERETFYFNSLRYFAAPGSTSALSTVAGKEFYAQDDLPLLVNSPHISNVVIEAFNNRYSLNERTPQWIDDASVSNDWRGLPTDYCMQSESLRLYPVPDAIYPLIIDGTVRFPPLVNTTDFNPWTNEAERLIRIEAKRILFNDITRDADQVQAMESELMGNPGAGRQGVLAMLRRETSRRAGGPGKLRASRGYM